MNTRLQLLLYCLCVFFALLIRYRFQHIFFSITLIKSFKCYLGFSFFCICHFIPLIWDINSV